MSRFRHLDVIASEWIIAKVNVGFVDSRIDKSFEMFHVLSNGVGLEMIVKKELLEIVYQLRCQFLEFNMAPELGQQPVGGHPVPFGTFFGLGSFNVLFNEIQE